MYGIVKKILKSIYDLKKEKLKKQNGKDTEIKAILVASLEIIESGISAKQQSGLNLISSEVTDLLICACAKLK